MDYLPPGDPASLLTPTRRRHERDLLASGHPVDVLVVGGGITGTGVALDAATRGLTVALIEAHDFAFGTSRWSSKLVHGGVRYLARGQVGVAWESAVERAVLMTRTAPHLVRPFATLVPFMDDTPTTSRLSTKAGLRTANSLRVGTRVPRSTIPPPRVISAGEAMRLVPGLPVGRLESAIVGWDGQLEDDARLVVTVARTAAAYGAHLLTNTAALEIGADGATVEDKLDGGTYRINARNVVNASGVWAGTLDSRIKLHPSRGSHLVVRAHDMGHPSAALTVPVPGTFGRFVFAVPQPDDLIYIGLTDVEAPGELPDVPTAPEADITWILDVINRALARPLDRSQVVGTYAGLRPLVSLDDGEQTADISRRHLVLGGPGEVITVTGGKLTTYRRMAQDAVNRITDIECRTKDVPLIGAGPVRPTGTVPQRLIRRYGSEAPLIAALADKDPSLLLPIGAEKAPLVDVRGVELLWGLLAEGANTEADLLERRTRVSMVPQDRAAVAGAVQALIDSQNAAASQPG